MPDNAGRRSSRSLVWARRVTQTLMLAVLGQWSLYGIFRCPFPVPFVSCQSCPVIACWGRITGLFWGTWGLVLVSTVFFGRSFCAWACPGGLLHQLIGKAAPLKMRSRGRLSKIAPYGLFIGWAAAALLWLGLDNPRWMIPIRVGEFWNAIALSFEHAGPFWLIRTLVVSGIIAGGFAVANLWCRCACPTGGLLEFFKQVSLFRIFKTGACNDCDACLKVCDMGTRPGELNCTSCGDCLGSCPVDAIRAGRKEGGT